MATTVRDVQRLLGCQRHALRDAVQVRHCNDSLKHTESAYYEELASGFSSLVSGCKADPQVLCCSCTSS